MSNCMSDGPPAVRSSRPLEECLDGFTAWARGAEHVSANWLPWHDDVSTTAMHHTDEAPTPGAATRRYANTVGEIRGGLIALAGRVRPNLVPGLTDRGGGPARPYVDVSHRVFTFPQPVRFLAMEHALPLAEVPDAIRALRGALRAIDNHSPYSIGIRVGAGDDTPLSPAYGRPTGYVNLTVPRTSVHRQTLVLAEHLLRDFDARPHWGKAHTADADVLAPRYPEWELFQRVRRRFDPDGVFPHRSLARLLERAPVTTG